MAATTSLLDLPVELLLLTFSFLDVNGFLNLTSTCKDLHKPEYFQDATYWSTLVRTTFRVPNQPAVEKDGKRWQKLYKRMLTQSKIYTWGNNERACLGHSYELPASMENTVRPGSRRYNMLRRRHVPWPEPMRRVEDLGVISDLQCGGWSTTLLTARGALYTVGSLDGLHVNPPQKLMMEPMPLKYPSGFPHPYDRYEPAVAVQQFSSGRSHVLALSDSGRIWSWQDIEQPAYHVKFIQHDTIENGRGNGKGTVKKVVAGWNKSAALIEGVGIILWDVLEREGDPTDFEDTALVIESIIVPNTSYAVPKRKRGERISLSSNAVSTVGEVLNFVVLEEVVVFHTHIGKVFVAQIFWDDDNQHVGEPVELELPSLEGQGELFVTDVQGSFQSFGVFTSSGAVLISKQERLEKYLQDRLGETLYTRIPALQNRNVIQLAFGDYHLHALHSPGYITSYGTEPQHCGALGLGSHAERRLRGLRSQAAGGDGRLMAHAYTEGRRVWFEREKRAWVQFLTSGGVDPSEAMERVRMAIGSPNVHCMGEVSEWVEQQGRDWEEKFGISDEDEDGLGAYFALSVAAAGWHSGALVLENDKLVEKLKHACEMPDENLALPPLSEDFPPNGDETSHTEVPGITTWLVNQAVATGADWARWFLGMPPYDAQTLAGHQAHMHGALTNMDLFRRGMHPINYGASPCVGKMYVWAKDHFPRLRLSDGTEMPGSVEFDEWRYPRPDWDLDVTF